MRRIAATLAAVLAALAMPGLALAQETPVEELLADPEGRVGLVTLRGELVGDFGFRGDGWVWTQLNDDSYADAPILEGGPLVGGNVGVGVRLPHELIDGIDRPGGYRYRGPIVSVTGIWRHHDPERGGETYLEATSLTLVEHGRSLEEGPHWGYSIAGLTLLMAAAGLWLTRKKAV